MDNVDRDDRALHLRDGRIQSISWRMNIQYEYNVLMASLAPCGHTAPPAILR